MNQAAFRSYITTKAQMLEPDDEDACDEFVSKRYELIYNSFFWKDSLAMVNVTVDPVNNLDHAAGIVLLPQMIDRLAGIRTANNSVRIQGLEHFFRIDWDSFGAGGQTGFCPSEMAILNPIWLTVRPNPDGGQSLIPSDAVYTGIGTYALFGDLVAGQEYILTMADVTNIGVQCGNNNGGGGLIDPVNLTPASGVPLVFTANGDSIFIFGLGVAGDPLNSSLVTFLPASPNQSIGDGATVTITSDNVADVTGAAAIQVKVTWRDQTDRYVVTSGLPLTLTPADGAGFIEIESVFKPTSAGNLTVTVNNPIGSHIFYEVAGTLAPALLQSPSYQRVRIFPIPAASTTLNVLGKKPFTPMTFDTEVPAIRNLDNCLIAFALGDMMQRGRHFAKAKDQYQEGAILLKELALLEALQAAHCSSIEPDSGFGTGCPSPRSNFGYY